MSQSYSIKGPVRAGPVTSAVSRAVGLASIVAIWLNRRKDDGLAQLDDRLLARCRHLARRRAWEAASHSGELSTRFRKAASRSGAREL